MLEDEHYFKFSQQNPEEKAECLIVAFAASQGQPEWSSIVGNLDSRKTNEFIN